MEEQFEYELIEFLVEPESTTSCTQMVCDESDPLYGPIEYDENGIPKGSTMELGFEGLVQNPFLQHLFTLSRRFVWRCGKDAFSLQRDIVII